MIRTTAEKVRDQVIRGVRVQLPVEDASAVSEAVLPRTSCPTLTERTWSDVNGCLPIGWMVTELTARIFKVQVCGRRA